MATKATTNLGSSIFWIVTILSALIGIIYLGIWSFHAKSIEGVVIAFIFFAMIVSGIFLSKFEIFSSGYWGQNALSFTIGFSIWIFLGKSENSVLSISQNALFSSIASQLPFYLEFIFNTFIIPISEELFWMIGIPYTIISVMELMGKRFSITKNSVLQLIVITAVTGMTFAIFHVGKYFLAFLVAAFIFRAVLVWSVIGDAKLNWMPYLAIVPALALGAHIGNNWGTYGFSKGLGVLYSTNQVISWMILAFLAIIFLSAANQLLLVIKSGKEKVVPA